jgi:hypothetical protein
VDVSFSDPTTTSLNLKSSAQLAAEFVALRSTCSADIPGFKGVYYKSREVACNAAQVASALEDVQACITQNFVPSCHCYNSILFQPFGVACRDDADLSDMFNSICNQISDCRDAYINEICIALLSKSYTDLLWLWSMLGILGGGLLFLGFLYQRKMWCFKPRSKMSDKTMRGHG